MAENPHPHLLQLVENKKFRDDFSSKLRKLIEARNRADEHESDNDADPLDITREDIRSALNATLEKHVFLKVRPPYPLTLEDIEQTAYAELGNLQSTKEDYPRFLKAWNRFLTSLRNLFWIEEITGDDIDLGHWTPGTVTFEEYRRIPILWSPVEGLWFSLAHRVQREHNLPYFNSPLVGYFWGALSDDASKKATDDFRDVAQSIAKTIERLSGEKTDLELSRQLTELKISMELFLHDFDDPDQDIDIDNLGEEEPEESGSTIDDTMTRSHAEDGIRATADSVDALFPTWGLRLFCSCAEAYFETPERLKRMKRGIGPRLKNAVVLLAEADAQSLPAIALSLSFSAIEALVCKETTGIVDQLSRNVATLLEPNSLGRPDAIRFIKTMYNQRSKALHGESVEAEENDAEKVRRLAAAVLHAVVEWQGYQNAARVRLRNERTFSKN